MRRLLALLLWLCLCAPVTAQPLLDTTSPFLRDLLSWHPVVPGLMGSRWYDLHGSAHAAMVGTWAWRGDSSGRFAGTLTLSGAGRAEIPHTGAHTFSVSDVFSLSLWFSTTNTTTLTGLWNKLDLTAPSWGYQLFLYDTGQFSWYFQADDGSDTGIKSTAAWNDGRLHHVVATYAGTGIPSGMALYVDGQVQTTTDDCGTCNITAGGILNTAPTCMGAYADGNFPFQGRLTNVMVYNRVLTPTDVQALYQMQAPDYGGLLLDEALALVQSAPAAAVRKHKGIIQ